LRLWISERSKTSTKLSTGSVSVIWTVSTPLDGRILMNRIARLLVSITALAVLASACGGADDEAAEAPSTT
jgi:hypothetical protein